MTSLLFFAAMPVLTRSEREMIWRARRCINALSSIAYAVTLNQFLALLEMPHDGNPEHRHLSQDHLKRCYKERFEAPGCDPKALFECIPLGPDWDWLRAAVNTAAALVYLDSSVAARVKQRRRAGLAD